MVECPVCGKWLKNIFALNGHMRLKEDKLPHAYFETHKKQIQKKVTTDIENQLQILISFVKEKGELLETQHDNILLNLVKLVRLLEKINPYPTTPIVQSKVKAEIPEKKEGKIPTFAELIKQYGSFENAVEYVNHWTMLDAIDKNPNLNPSKKWELKDIVWKKWS